VYGVRWAGVQQPPPAATQQAAGAQPPGMLLKGAVQAMQLRKW
jgi:hypothetical protein